MSIFEQLSKLLVNEDATINIKMKKIGHRVRVVITPTLGPAPEDADEVLLKAFEAFSLPLLVVEIPSQLETALASHLAEYATVQTDAAYAVENKRKLLKEVHKTPTNPKQDKSQSKSKDDAPSSSILDQSDDDI